MERLRILRESAGMTQREVSKSLNISRTTYTKYETGDREPDFHALQRLADYFNVSTDFLLGRTDNPEPYP